MPLEIKNVTKEYGGKKVLEDFSLTLPDYGCYAFLGPSGCGKTTLLRLISGLEAPDAGSISLPADSRVSYVFQEDRLLPALTAAGNIMAVLNRGERAGKALSREWLKRVGLEGEEESYPSQLSGGMKRRVAIARALAYGGEALLLDEPFSGLDADTKTQMQNLALSGLDARIRLNILVTHDVNEALYTANKIFLLSGPPLTVIDAVTVDIPVEKRRGAEDVLVWHKEYIMRKLSSL